MIARKLKNSLLLLFILLCQIISAQQPKYKAKINTNVKAGYQKICLSTEIIAVSNPDLSDIRILDKSGIQVPYFNEYFQPFTITKIEKKIFSDFKVSKQNKQTIIQFTNIPQRTIDYLTLTINNTKVTKQYSILGSLDNKNWYSLIDKEILSEMYDNSSTKIDKTINLPTSNLSYYKIEINDSNSAPILVSEISNNQYLQSHKSEKNQIKNFKLTYSKLNNDNIIDFNSDYKFKIDEIKINTMNKGLFQRNISISKEYKYKKRTETEVVYQGQLTNKNNVFEGLNLIESKFKITITNGDNQPLAISSIDLYQYPIYLITELIPNQEYTITTGDKSAKAPNYDIVNFKDKIPSDLPIIEISNLESTSSVIESSSSQKFYQQKWFMWSCLGLGVLVIFYISIAMINSLNKNTV